MRTSQTFLHWRPLMILCQDYDMHSYFVFKNTFGLVISCRMVGSIHPDRCLWSALCNGMTLRQVQQKGTDTVSQLAAWHDFYSFIPRSRSTEFSEQCSVGNIGINDWWSGRSIEPPSQKDGQSGNSVEHHPFAFWKGYHRKINNWNLKNHPFEKENNLLDF